MIQRVQSIFMFLAATAMIATTFLPLWEKADTATGKLATMTAFEVVLEQKTANDEMEVTSTYNVTLISVGAWLAAAVMLFSISRYKSRITQVKLNALFSLITAATLVGIFYYVIKANALLLPEKQGNYLLGFYLPIVAMMNNIIANRFIRKDEKLVRSADRIR